MVFYHFLMGCIVVSFLIALIDLFRGSPWGIGEELHKGFDMAGPLLLLMTGYICLAPVLAAFLKPRLLPVSDILGVDPSFIVGLILAVDSGGASLAAQIANDQQLGIFSGYIVGSVLGPTLTFTVPVALMGKNREESFPLIQGLLAGVIASPVGIFVGGVLMEIPMPVLLRQMVPLLACVMLLAAALVKAPYVVASALMYVARFSLVITYGGLVCVLVQKLFSWSILPGLLPFNEAAVTVGGIALLLGGAYPFVRIIYKVFRPCIKACLSVFHLTEEGSGGIMMTLVNSMATFTRMKSMSTRDVVLNTAFAISGAWMLGDHLGFVVQTKPDVIVPVILSKLGASAAALFLADLIMKFKRMDNAIR
jgi:ethanolamine transporter